MLTRVRVNGQASTWWTQTGPARALPTIKFCALIMESGRLRDLWLEFQTQVRREVVNSRGDSFEVR